MIDRKKNIFDWNYISGELREEHIKELKSYYRTYHKKSWAYKQAMKRFKKLKWIANSASIVFASGGLASSIATGGISLVAISAAALLIQAWMKHQNLDLKIHNCQYAYQSYDRLLIMIKEATRSGNFEKDSLINSMTNTDNYVADNSPVVDKYLKKYDDHFITEGSDEDPKKHLKKYYYIKNNQMVKNIYGNNMIKKDLEKLKSQLIDILLKSQEAEKPVKPKKLKNEIGLEYIIKDNLFPEYVEKEDPFDKAMRKVKRKGSANWIYS